MSANATTASFWIDMRPGRGPAGARLWWEGTTLHVDAAGEWRKDLGSPPSNATDDEIHETGVAAARDLRQSLENGRLGIEAASPLESEALSQERDLGRLYLALWANVFPERKTEDIPTELILRDPRLALMDPTDARAPMYAQPSRDGRRTSSSFQKLGQVDYGDFWALEPLGALDAADLCLYAGLKQLLVDDLRNDRAITYTSLSHCCRLVGYAPSKGKFGGSQFELVKAMLGRLCSVVYRDAWTDASGNVYEHGRGIMDEWFSVEGIDGTAGIALKWRDAEIRRTQRAMEARSLVYLDQPTLIALRNKAGAQRLYVMARSFPLGPNQRDRDDLRLALLPPKDSKPRAMDCVAGVLGIAHWRVPPSRIAAETRQHISDLVAVCPGFKGVRVERGKTGYVVVIPKGVDTTARMDVAGQLLEGRRLGYGRGGGWGPGGAAAGVQGGGGWGTSNPDESTPIAGDSLSSASAPASISSHTLSSHTTSCRELTAGRTNRKAETGPPSPLTGVHTGAEPRAGKESGGAAALPTRDRPLSPSANFAAFWEAYPKRVERPAAERAWSDAITAGTPPEKLVAAAKNYARERLDEPDRFTKKPANFLRDDAWRECATSRDDEDDSSPTCPRHHIYFSRNDEGLPWCDRCEWSRDGLTAAHCERCKVSGTCPVRLVAHADSSLAAQLAERAAASSANHDVNALIAPDPEDK